MPSSMVPAMLHITSRRPCVRRRPRRTSASTSSASATSTLRATADPPAHRMAAAVSSAAASRDVGAVHGGAGAGQHLGRGPPYAAARPGHHGHPSVRSKAWRTVSVGLHRPSMPRGRAARRGRGRARWGPRAPREPAGRAPRCARPRPPGAPRRAGPGRALSPAGQRGAPADSSAEQGARAPFLRRSRRARPRSPPPVARLPTMGSGLAPSAGPTGERPSAARRPRQLGRR